MSLKQLFILIERANMYHVLLKTALLHKLQNVFTLHLLFLVIFCTGPAVYEIQILDRIPFSFLGVSRALIPTVLSFMNKSIFWWIDHCNPFILRWWTKGSQETWKYFFLLGFCYCPWQKLFTHSHQLCLGHMKMQS